MWPHTLQMTRDECRGILRRLELESYSHVISVFRAQGGLSEKKAKLLEELRNVFHISQERHRAEARRVSNDEELSTIAELISGPNTWQEWSREGRRAFPMLPRVAPQTALSITANKVAEFTMQDNAKLPYPSATADTARDDDHNNNMELEYKIPAFSPNHPSNVVICDPFKMPDIPAVHKKNLKRNMSTSEHHHGQHCGNNQKRCLSESMAQSNLYGNQLQQKFFSNNNNNNHLDMPVGKLTKKEEQIIQQRYFLSQQNKAKKQNAIHVKRANSAVKNSNSQNTMSKKSQKALLKQQKNLEKEEALKRQQLQQQQQFIQIQQSDLQMQNNYTNNIIINENLHNQQQQQEEATAALQIQLQPEQYKTPQMTAVAYSPTATVHVIPHSGAPTKKDKNSPKSNISTKSIAGSQNLLTTTTTAAATAASPIISTTPTTTTTNVVVPLAVIATTKTATTTTTKTVTPITNLTSTPLTKLEQKILLSTPVQKYIVEDRLITPAAITVPPQSLDNSGSITNSSCSGQVAVTSAQIMTLPHITAAANKLRAINTTILPPGTKIQPASMVKKELTNNSSLGTLGIISDQQLQSQQHIFNVITNADGITNLSLPTHAPPSIMNLHNNNNRSSSNNNNNMDSAMSLNQAFTAIPTQGKVLTTKLLPIVLSNTAIASSANNNNNNNVNVLPLSSGTIIKSVTPTVMLSTNAAAQISTNANSGNTYISTLSSGAQVFRKPSILRKATVTPVTPVSSSTLTNVKALNVNTGVLNTAAGAILGSYKVTSTIAAGTSTMMPLRRVVMPINSLNTTSTTATITSTTTTTSSTSTSSSGSVSSAILRPAYKLTPSSNGNLFIQTASGGNSKFQTSPITNNQQRVPLQNVKIISPTVGCSIGSTFPLQQARTTTTLMVNNKCGGNMLFLPATNKNRITTTTAVTSLTTATTSTLINQNVQLIQKPNVVLINTSSGGNNINNNNRSTSVGNTMLTQTQYKLLTTNATNCLDNNHGINNNNNNNSNNNNTNNNSNDNTQINKIVRGSNQLINDEDLDILNMPIVVEDNDNNNSIIDSTSTDVITYTNLITSQAQQQPQQQQHQQPITERQLQQQTQRQHTGNVVLGIDWEMELDQVAAAAATRAPRFTRRAYSVCSTAQPSNKSQSFVLPKQLGRTLQAQIDASGLLANNNNNKSNINSNKLGGLTIGFPRVNLKNRHIIGNKTTNINNIIIDNNDNNNISSSSQVKKVIVIKPKDHNIVQKYDVSNSGNVKKQEQPQQQQIVINSSSGGNNNELNTIDESGCIAMDLENNIIETTTPSTTKTTTTPTADSNIEKCKIKEPPSIVIPTATSTKIIKNDEKIMELHDDGTATTTTTSTTTIHELTKNTETETISQTVGCNLREELMQDKDIMEPCTSSQQLLTLQVDVNAGTSNLKELIKNGNKNDKNTLQEVMTEEQQPLLHEGQNSYNGMENQLSSFDDNIFEGRDYYELDAEKTNNILLAASSSNDSQTHVLEENFTTESGDSADV